MKNEEKEQGMLLLLTRLKAEILQKRQEIGVAPKSGVYLAEMKTGQSSALHSTQPSKQSRSQDIAS